MRLKNTATKLLITSAIIFTVERLYVLIKFYIQTRGRDFSPVDPPTFYDNPFVIILFVLSMIMYGWDLYLISSRNIPLDDEKDLKNEESKDDRQ